MNGIHSFMGIKRNFHSSGRHYEKRGFPLRESWGIFFGGSTYGSLPSDQILASYYFFLGYNAIRLYYKKHFETVNFILGHFVNFLEEIYQENILEVSSPLSE